MMFDNLRESASQSPFFQNQKPPDEQKPAPQKTSSSTGSFLGMTPVQRFIIALMLLMMVCVFGSFILIATGKIWL
jgi:hypothetical protein